MRIRTGAACRLAVAIALMPLVADAGVLRVCADPNNLPFSNSRGEGFENRIAALAARDLRDRLEYAYALQNARFIRHTLAAGKCDVIVGAPAGMDALATTRPYYASTYVFVARKADHLGITSFGDPRLRKLRIGVHLIGDESTPPALALAKEGIVDNVRGFMVYGDYESPDPVSPIVEAVASGDVDVAIVWGPPAGYFAAKQKVKLAIDAVPPSTRDGDPPMRFDIAMGVRKADKELAAEVDRALAARRADIDAILAAYHVPRFDEPEARK